MINRFGGFGAFILSQWEKYWGFCGAPLLFSRLFFMEGCSEHLSPAFPLASPGVKGQRAPSPLPAALVDTFGELLEAVGSGSSSLSWHLHLEPIPAAWLDFGAELWMRRRGTLKKEEEMFAQFLT